MLVPVAPDDPAADANRKAWDVLRSWDRPFLTAFSDLDPAFGGAAAPGSYTGGLSIPEFFQQTVPGAQGQPHTTIVGAGHFLQEDKGPELARAVVDFIRQS
jgi:haloalkane dehalogenase